MIAPFVFDTAARCGHRALRDIVASLTLPYPFRSARRGELCSPAECPTVAVIAAPDQVQGDARNLPYKPGFVVEVRRGMKLPPNKKSDNFRKLCYNAYARCVNGGVRLNL